MDIPKSNKQYWQEKVSIKPPRWFSFLQTFCVFNIMLGVLIIAWTNTMGIHLGETLSISLVIIPILFCLVSAISLAIWGTHHPPEERTFIVAEVPESEIVTEHIESIYTNGIPQELYRQGQLYARLKSRLDGEQVVLQKMLQSDIAHIGTSSATIETIHQQIDVLRSSITDTTDALIDIMPTDMDMLEKFEHRDIFYKYLDYLRHEMGSIQDISKKLQSDIQQWMIYHHIEVQSERRELVELLRDGDTKLSESMSILLTLSRTLQETSGQKQITDILIKQKI